MGKYWEDFLGKEDKRQCHTCEHYNDDRKICTLYDLEPKKVCSYSEECETYKKLDGFKNVRRMEKIF